GRLAALKTSLADDNTFRTDLVRGGAGGAAGDRGYILDYAGNAMRLAGLDFLQIQNDEGRVVSSGHFRNEFDRMGPAIPHGAVALLPAAAAGGAFLALVPGDSLRLGKTLRLIGGVAVDSSFLARLTRDPELGVALALPRDSVKADSTPSVVAVVTLPFVDAADGPPPGHVEQAGLVATRSTAFLSALHGHVN